MPYQDNPFAGKSPFGDDIEQILSWIKNDPQLLKTVVDSLQKPATTPTDWGKFMGSSAFNQMAGRNDFLGQAMRAYQLYDLGKNMPSEAGKTTTGIGGMADEVIGKVPVVGEVYGQIGGWLKELLSLFGI